jgi:hypothetical protein
MVSSSRLKYHNDNLRNEKKSIFILRGNDSNLGAGGSSRDQFFRIPDTKNGL